MAQFGRQRTSSDSGQTCESFPGSFAAQCLVARRLVERGVRVVEVFDVGSNSNWDSHSNIDDHRTLSRNVDRPISAPVSDLKRRGLLDETLIIGRPEFRPDAVARPDPARPRPSQPLLHLLLRRRWCESRD